MFETFSCELPICVQPQARLRHVPRGTLFDPTAAHKTALKYLLTAEIRTKHEQLTDFPLFPSSQALEVRVLVVQGRTQKRSHIPVSARKYPDLPRWDVDNVAKTILDVGNGILWEDDRQIARLSIEKAYGPDDRTEIEVSCVRQAAKP